MRPILHVTTVLFALALLLTTSARAENIQDFGDYVVHYNALTTDMIPPMVARENNITRSKNRAMLNVVVLEKVLGASGKPTAAEVSGRSISLTGKQNRIEFREVREPNAIYYIAEFAVSNEQRLTFDITVTPEGASEPLEVRFRKQFFTD